MLQSVVLQIHRNVFSSNQTPLCSEPICFYRFQFSDRFKKPISLKVLAHFFNRLGMKSSRTQARVCKMWLICWENSLANPSLDCVYVCVCVNEFEGLCWKMDQRRMAAVQPFGLSLLSESEWGRVSTWHGWHRLWFRFPYTLLRKNYIYFIY